MPSSEEASFLSEFQWKLKLRKNNAPRAVEMHRKYRFLQVKQEHGFACKKRGNFSLKKLPQIFTVQVLCKRGHLLFTMSFQYTLRLEFSIMIKSNSPKRVCTSLLHSSLLLITFQKSTLPLVRVNSEYKFAFYQRGCNYLLLLIKTAITDSQKILSCAAYLQIITASYINIKIDRLRCFRNFRGGINGFSVCFYTNLSCI